MEQKIKELIIDMKVKATDKSYTYVKEELRKTNELSGDKLRDCEKQWLNKQFQQQRVSICFAP